MSGQIGYAVPFIHGNRKAACVGHRAASIMVTGRNELSSTFRNHHITSDSTLMFSKPVQSKKQLKSNDSWRRSRLQGQFHHTLR
jgi:hypothetical protein